MGNICKQMAGNLVNEHGNMPRRGSVPRFSDLEVIALNMTSEAIGIDSESFLFAKLQEYKKEVPHLISRRQYNDRRKFTTSTTGISYIYFPHISFNASDGVGECVKTKSVYHFVILNASEESEYTHFVSTDSSQSSE